MSQYQNSYGGYNQSYGQNNQGGYGQGNPYTSTQNSQPGPFEDVEMGSYGQQGPPVHSQKEFLQRVQRLRLQIGSLSSDIQSIATEHQRVLAGNDPGATAKLNDLIASTQLKNTSIRGEIQVLKTDAERTTDASHEMRKRQVETLSRDFKEEVRKYLEEEQRNKERYREQISRQYRIVNPDASEDDVRRAADADWGNEGVFQQALRTNRSGQANAVLGAVRARHNELQRIEQSIQELAGLFQDLDTLVIMQEATVVRAEEQTEQTNVNLHKGNEEVSKANEHARRRRKLKWWCLIITILIILIAIGVGVGVYFQQKAIRDAATGR